MNSFDRIASFFQFDVLSICELSIPDSTTTTSLSVSLVRLVRRLSAIE